MLRQAEFVNRREFAGYLNRAGLTGEAAEIGVHRADFAAAFLAPWEGRLLHLVDPWATLPGYEDQAKLLWNSESRDKDFEAAKHAVRKSQDRAHFLRRTSQEAAPLFPDESLDFVYIDADHRYSMVLEDLRAWWPKVRVGGLLAGHDFICPGETGPAAGVQPAVLDFAERLGMDIFLVVEQEALPWSYFLVRQ